MQETKNKDSEIIETRLGFQDVTKCVREGFSDLKKYDVIRGVLVRRIDLERRNYGYQKGRVVGVGNFFIPEIRIGGRVFPEDEILEEGGLYDIIIQKIEGDQMDVNVYHDFEIGEQIPVEIGCYSHDSQDPSFKLFNKIPGFVKTWNPKIPKPIEIGDVVLSEVRKLSINNRRISIKTHVLELLE